MYFTRSLSLRTQTHSHKLPILLDGGELLSLRLEAPKEVREALEPLERVQGVLGATSEELLEESDVEGSSAQPKKKKKEINRKTYGTLTQINTFYQRRRTLAQI